MEIKPEEISNIEEVGSLDGQPLKMIRCIGGFHMMVGRPKGQMRDSVLGAGSHPAIVKYSVEKQYPSAQFHMMKSELLSDGSIVDKHSHFLSEDLRKSGHDIYSVENGLNVDFYVTKHNSNIATLNGILEKDAITMKTIDFPKEFAKALAGASVEKALATKSKKLRIGKNA